MFMKHLICAVGAAAILTANAANAETTPSKPAPAVVSTATDVPQGAIKVGNTYCPIVPTQAVSDKTRALLEVVSTTCILQATGRISDFEAQSIYDQAGMSLQESMAMVYAMPDNASVPGSAPVAVASR